MTLQIDALTERGNAYLEAPAGYGKTYTIAKAANIASQSGRVLILTHTHAGVASLRRQVGQNRNCDISTISGFMLRLVRAYPTLCDFDTSDPMWERRFSDIQVSFKYLLSLEQIQDIIHCSYSMLFVDEYQDCEQGQHASLMSIGNFISTKIVGDPLQAIFDFRDSDLVNLTSQIPENYYRIPPLNQPMRWIQAGNPKLGEWLDGVRQTLKNKESVSLINCPVQRRWADNIDAKLHALFRYQNRIDERCVAIINVTPKGHALARSSGGLFHVMEEIECKRLMKLATILDKDDRKAHICGLRDLISKCRVGFAKFLSENQVKSGLKGSLRREDLQEIQGLIIQYVESGERSVLLDFFEKLTVAGKRTDALELLSETRRMIKRASENNDLTYQEAALATRRVTAQRGRLAESKSIASTWLIKGLEFEHAIILEPEELNNYNLYVAMTRGTKSLTIVTNKNYMKSK